MLCICWEVGCDHSSLQKVKSLGEAGLLRKTSQSAIILQPEFATVWKQSERNHYASLQVRQIRSQPSYSTLTHTESGFTHWGRASSL